MKGQVAQFTNEIVSIAVMLLMAIALIAGQTMNRSETSVTADTDTVTQPIVIEVTNDVDW